jgi:hypothetical protein
MANTSLALAEEALRARKLDRTLTTHLARLTPAEVPAASTGVVALDTALKSGLPRGHLSELAGARSSGRTTLLLQWLAVATRRGEIAAVIDTFDALDLVSVVSAGINLDRLLWIRGHDVSRGAMVEHVVDRALKAFNLVLQAGGFGVVALDFAEVPLHVLQRLPFTTWLRVQRTIEGTDTACLLLVSQPVARSAGGHTLCLTAHPTWRGDADRSRQLTGLDVGVRIVSPRSHTGKDVHVRCGVRS